MLLFISLCSLSAVLQAIEIVFYYNFVYPYAAILIHTIQCRMMICTYIHIYSFWLHEEFQNCWNEHSLWFFMTVPYSFWKFTDVHKSTKRQSIKYSSEWVLLKILSLQTRFTAHKTAADPLVLSTFFSIIEKLDSVAFSVSTSTAPAKSKFQACRQLRCQNQMKKGQSTCNINVCQTTAAVQLSWIMAQCANKN